MDNANVRTAMQKANKENVFFALDIISISYTGFVLRVPNLNKCIMVNVSAQMDYP